MHPQVPGTVLNPGVTVVIKTDTVPFLLNLPVLQRRQPGKCAEIKKLNEQNENWESREGDIPGARRVGGSEAAARKS